MIYINGKKAETQRVKNRDNSVSESDSNNECYVSSAGVRYPEPLVPLAIGGNPNGTGFDDAEWFSGEVYLARIYNGALTPEEIENNYYSNMMTVKGYSQNANVVSLSGGGITSQIEKYQISKKAKEDVKIFYTNSILLRINHLEKKDKKMFIKEIRKRKMNRNIKPRNVKQLVKRIILEINIPLYLKIR